MHYFALYHFCEKRLIYSFTRGPAALNYHKTTDLMNELKKKN